MIVLVLGTPDSGKSKIAEDIVMRLAEGLDPRAARGGEAAGPAGAVSTGASVARGEAAGPAASSGMDKLYIATMIPFGAEGNRRIEKHRKMRAGKGFLTVEKYTEVDSLIGEIRDLGDKCCLLECMSNLVGNEMHDPRNLSLSDKDLEKLITEEVLALGKSCGHLVVVANCFLTEDEGYDDETRRYVRIADHVNGILKDRADETCELAEGEWHFL